MSKPRILLLDIETLPIRASTWGIWNQNIALNQIMEDWTIAAWAAKWLGDPASKMVYRDQRNAKNIRYEKPILRDLWKLIDEADILITQNGKRFDIPKINARLIQFDFNPPSPCQHIDTRLIAKKFGFTSNRLEYLCKVLKTKHQKLKHADYPGQDLWTAVEKGDLKAWKEMERYNKNDVLCLEDVYLKFRAWNNDGVNMSVYQTGLSCTNCTSKSLTKNGFRFTSQGKYQRYQCHSCGAYMRGTTNLLSKKNKKVH